MPTWILELITLVLGLVLGGLITFRRMKWKLQQDRKTAWAKKREPIYSQGLEFIYDVEKHQINEEELERILESWAKWFPLNAIYLPPSVNDALHSAMFWIRPITIDLHNKAVDKKTTEIFKEKLMSAKKMLMESVDIGWLPEDLR